MKRIYYLIFCALLFSACDKTLEVDDLHFDVKTDKTSYKAGDTVNFIFSGKPDNITFYSGETGSKYKFRERLNAEGSPRLQFTSYRQYGIEENTLSLLASTDFTGKVDENISSSGTWVDITSRAVLSTGKDNTESGIIDLAEFVTDKPLYIAFKYVGHADPKNAQRTWTIKNFVVENELEDGPVLPIATMENAGWTAVSILNPDRTWAISADQIKLAGGPKNTPDNEDWIVTKPLELSRVKPDQGTAIKSLISDLPNYSYVYSQPGEYTVTFVVSNATADQQKTMVKELTVKVEP